MSAPVTLQMAEATALQYLRRLGKTNHPSAAEDPVSALGQVAVDKAQVEELLRAEVRALRRDRDEWKRRANTVDL